MKTKHDNKSPTSPEDFARLIGSHPIWSANGMRAAVRVILGQKPRETRRSLTRWTEGTRALFGSSASSGRMGLALAGMAAKPRD